MSKNKFTLAACLAASTCLTAVASPAFAQDTAPEDTGGFKEIIVTARSQGESLMQVPVAVTAMTAEDVARYATTDLVKLAGVRPDVEIYTGGSKTGANFIVRGVGTTADTAGVESSVSIAIDGVQTLRPRIAYAGLFDLAQVEIMKGPQALFFGKNASAGVVSIKSALPTAEFGGYVHVGYEFESQEKYAEAAVNFPITDTLRTRFAGRYSKLRGWVKNIATAVPDWTNPSVILPAPHSKYNGSESKAGRFTMMWEPDSSYSAVFRATFAGSEGSSNSAVETLCPSGQAISLGSHVEPNVDCKLNGVTAMNDQNPLYSTVPSGFGFDNRYDNGRDQHESDSTLISLEQKLDLGVVSLQSITGYSKSSFAYRGNSSYAQTAQFNGGTNEAFTGYSQEVRAVTNLDGPFNFTAGAFFERTHLQSGATLFLYNFGPDNVCPTTQPGCTPTNSLLSGINEADYRQKTQSFFGQARFKISEELELAGGARYTKVKKAAFQGQPHYVHYFFENIGALLGEGVYMRDKLTEDNWSPEATLTWQPDNNNTVYIAYKTGYKTGGIAQPSLVTPSDVGNVTFNPEKARGGEVGYKGYLMDRKIRLQVTAFMYKFKGLQLTSFDPLNARYKIQNAADVKQKGVEFNVEFKASDALSFRLGGAYLSVKYGEFNTSGCWANQTLADGCVGGLQDLSGHQLHRAPKFVAGGGFTYETPVDSSGNLLFSLTGDVRYRSGTYTGETHNPAGYQKRNALFHASARIHDEKAGWEVAVIGRNLTNKRLIGFTSDRPSAQTLGNYEVAATAIRPREIAIQVGFKF
jgi:iron complex outermembrane receptor protein